MALTQAQLNFVGDFLAEVLQGNAAVFAGAGLSAPAGYVDWRNLLRPLAKDLELNIELENDLIAVAQFHVTYSGDNRHRLHTALLDALSKEARPTRNHELLARLPIKTFWTTNYDKLIENSLRETGQIVDVKSSVPQLATTRPNRDITLYKMHGDIDRPDEAIVTKDDYEKYGRDYEAFVTALAGDLVNKTFLFLGFSFTDPNLEHVLSQVRLNFRKNQRQHYAIFKTRQKLPRETDEDFGHHLARQRHTIEDLKRFNIKTILVDDYSHITDILQRLVSRYLRRTVFISASASDFSPWGQPAVDQFSQELGRKLIASGSRVATGLGLGIGNALFTGALREIMVQNMHIEDGLILRPFPLTGDPTQLARLWHEYRKELISHAGIGLFLFGNKQVSGATVIADGMVKEFEIAREQGVTLLPIGATGSAAKQLTDRCFAAVDELLPDLDYASRVALAEMSDPTRWADIDALIDPIVHLIGTVQERI